MKTATKFRLITFSLIFLLAACGGSGSGGNGGTVAASATTFINWTWINGSDVVFQDGNYGVIRTPASTNQPRALEGAASWTDSSGKLWMFGGGGIDKVASTSGDLNDLWEYSTNQWTWVNGHATINQLGNYPASVGNTNPLDASGPGARQYASTWADASGNLWLFGGYARIDSAGTTAYANDLWKYNIAARQWTWVNGANATTDYDQPGSYGSLGTANANNMPGSRYRAVSWQDASGNFWLFGGKGFDSTGTQGDLNDLWEYNPGTNLWTWVSGSEVIDHVGSYGTKGSPNGLNNFPGARSGGAGWYDSGHLWMFGGFGLAAAGTVGDLNDLWKFGIDSLASDYHQWTWVGGANSTGQSGSFGAAGSAGSNNIPPPRRSAVSWTDNSGNFWMFGGIRNSDDDLSDLWKYNPKANQWTWMSGWNAPKQSGTYGSQGSPAIANVPGARDLSVSWKDNAGKLWLFGGQGYDAQGSVGYLNDLWSFVPQ